MKNIFRLFGVFAVVALIWLSAASFTGSSNTSNTAAQERWEYMVSQHEVSSRRQIENLNQTLNELGAQGWELVSSSGTGTQNYNQVFVLKRRL